MSKNYLIYSKVKAAHNSENKIEVVCYDKILFYICPNPKNRALCEILEQQYRLNIYVAKETYKIRECDLNDVLFYA